MSLFRNPEEHAANPPETWQVDKVADRCWRLTAAGGTVTIDTFPTRKVAEAARAYGWAANLWHQETRWYGGEAIAGWKQYSPSL